MAFAEKRRNNYRIVFRFCGKRYTLKTDDPDVADTVVGGVNPSYAIGGKI